MNIQHLTGVNVDPWNYWGWFSAKRGFSFPPPPLSPRSYFFKRLKSCSYMRSFISKLPPKISPLCFALCFITWRLMRVYKAIKGAPAVHFGAHYTTHRPHYTQTLISAMQKPGHSPTKLWLPSLLSFFPSFLLSNNESWRLFRKNTHSPLSLHKLETNLFTKHSTFYVFLPLLCQTNWGPLQWLSTAPLIILWFFSPSSFSI